MNIEKINLQLLKLQKKSMGFCNSHCCLQWQEQRAASYKKGQDEGQQPSRGLHMPPGRPGAVLTLAVLSKIATSCHMICTALSPVFMNSVSSGASQAVQGG